MKPGTIEVALMGRVGSDPELKHVRGGELPLLSFSVAVDDGGDNTPTTWVRVALFGEKAEALAGQLTKAARVYVEGRLTLDTFEGRDGQTRASLKVSAWKVEVLGAIGKRRPPRAPSQRATEAASEFQGGEPLLDDDLRDPIDDSGRDRWPS